MDQIDMASLLVEPAPLCWDRLSACNADDSPPEWPEDPVSQALPWLVRHLGVADALSVALAEDEADAAREPHGEDPAVTQGAAAIPVLGESARLLPALERIGYDASLVRCQLDELTAEVLPAVLLLRGGDACVLTHIHRPRRGPVTLDIVMPGEPPLRFEVPMDELAAEYTGMSLMVQPTPGVDHGALDDLPDWAVPDETAAPPDRQPLSRLSHALRTALETPAPEPRLKRWRRTVAERLEDFLPGFWFTPVERWFKFAERRPISG